MTQQQQPVAAGDDENDDDDDDGAFAEEPAFVEEPAHEETALAVVEETTETVPKPVFRPSKVFYRPYQAL